MIPRSLALGVTQLNLLIITVIISHLPVGSMTVWSWADNLQNFPINIFGVSLALSAFPVFSQAFLDKDHQKFKNIFSQSFRRILFFIIPISVAILLLRAQIVRLVLGLGSGKFDWDATILTAQTLGFFSISLFAQASIPILARSFFAQQDTKTPVAISIFSVCINAVLAWWLSSWMGVYGLALAFSIASLLDMLMLLAALRVRMGDLDDRQIMNSTFKILVGALFMGLAIQGGKYLIAQFVNMRTYVGIFLQTAGALGVGGMVYLIIALYWDFSEVEIIKHWLKKIKKQLLNNNNH